jgi:hypothetical protein
VSTLITSREPVDPTSASASWSSLSSSSSGWGDGRLDASRGGSFSSGETGSGVWVVVSEMFRY